MFWKIIFRLCLRNNYLWKRNEEGVELLNPISKVGALFLVAVFHVLASLVNSLTKKAVICGTWVLLRNTQWAPKFMTRASSQGLRQKNVSFLICVSTWTIVQGSLLEFFLIPLWMFRNNSHASKYCQDLQNSHVSIVLSVSWARDFRIFLYCPRCLSRAGSSDQCCSGFVPFLSHKSPL